MNSVWSSLFNIDFKVSFINVNGVKTRCLEAGSGEPLILLHGIGGHLEAYCRNIVEHAKHFHVYAIDMIGHGFSSKPYDFDYEIPVYVKHLLEFMDVTNIQRASISGESLGGWVAAQFAADYPDRINKLVLNTAGGLIANKEVMGRIKRLTMEAVRNPTTEGIRKRLEFLMLYPKDVSQELVDIRMAVYQEPDMVKAMERILCLQELEIRQRNLLSLELLESIQAPTCVIWTTHDPTAPIEVGKIFVEHIPNSEFHVMEDCAHWPQYEQEEIFNRIHIEFLLR